MTDRLSSPSDVARVCESAGLRKMGEDPGWWSDHRVSVSLPGDDSPRWVAEVERLIQGTAEYDISSVADVHPGASSALLLAAIADARGPVSVVGPETGEAGQ